MQRISVLLFLSISLHSFAQNVTSIYVDQLKFSEHNFHDTLEATAYIQKLQMDWLDQGYYFVGLDSVLNSSSASKYFLHKGKKYRSALDVGGRQSLRNALTKELEVYMNHGHPFATVFLDSLSLQKDQLYGSIIVLEGPEIRYDSARFLSDLKTNKSYVYQLLDIEPNKLFSERDYHSIGKKIERSSFLELDTEPDISFQNNAATLYLEMREAASNTFRGVLGLQQGPSGQAIAVGSLDLNVKNLFRSGKQLKFNWERFSQESQLLNIYYKHPFILNSKISPSIRFNLLKQDTTFVNQTFGLGVNTYIGPTTEVMFEFDRSNGTLITSKVSEVAGKGLADFRRNMYRVMIQDGAEEELTLLKESLVWSVGLAAGRKSINRNLGLPLAFYDTIETETNYFQFEIKTAYQFKVGKRSSLFQSFELGGIKNEELLTNELYRIGGLNSLRGFNEKSIFAQYFGMSRLEFRSFFENRSFVYVFYDQLIYKKSKKEDHPFGIGLGFVLATSSGQFSFALAGGQSENQQLSFSEVRAHFGFISRF